MTIMMIRPLSLSFAADEPLHHDDLNFTQLHGYSICILEVLHSEAHTIDMEATRKSVRLKMQCLYYYSVFMHSCPLRRLTRLLVATLPRHPLESLSQCPSRDLS